VHEETGHEQQAELRKRINKLNMQHYHSIKQDFSNPSGLELMFLVRPPPRCMTDSVAACESSRWP
jgi:ribosomal protein S15P/S13E